MLHSGAVLSGGDQADELIDAYGVVWVLIGPWERAEYAASDEFWAERGERVIQQGGYSLYQVNPAAED